MAIDKPISWLGDLILVMFVIISFFVSISMIRDPMFHITLMSSKDIPLVHDSTLATSHNIESRVVLPNSTKLVFDQFYYKIGLTKIDKAEDEALAYPVIKNQNLMENINYDILQPSKEKIGEFNITVKNE